MGAIKLYANDDVVSSANPLPTTQSGTPALPSGAAIEAKQPALGVAGTPSADVITVQGGGYAGTSTLTRAANTTPYSIGDVVGGALTIAGAGPASADVLITSIRLKSIGAAGPTALPAGLQSVSIYIYGATPPSAIADNSPFTFAQGDWSSFIAQLSNIPIVALGVGSQGLQAQLDNIIQQFRCDSSGNLYAYVVTNQAFTPAANSETYRLSTRGILP